MHWLAIIFWIFFSLVFYTYIGYGVIIWIYLKLRGTSSSTPGSVPENHFLPSVALIIPAYNEADILEEKISNCLQLDYPAALLRIVFITDGSDDASVNILKDRKAVIHLHEPRRRGKAAAMNRAAALCSGSEILVFSDANTMLNSEALKRIVSHYMVPEVGGVSGEKKIISLSDNTNTEGEGIYWKYESFLKKLDSDFHTIVGAAGELFSVRQNLYSPLKENTILDDFVLSLKICERGYVIRYESGAVASELPTTDIGEEEKRKIRIGAGAFQGMIEMRALLNIFRFGKLSFQYISRRFFRWVVCPPALPILLFLNIIIVIKDISPYWLYTGLLYAQTGFYFFAFCGWLALRINTSRISLFYIPWYFLFMNISVWMGLFRYLNGSQSVLWDKSHRLHRRITSVDRKNT